MDLDFQNCLLFYHHRFPQSNHLTAAPSVLGPGEECVTHIASLTLYCKPFIIPVLQMGQLRPQE